MEACANLLFVGHLSGRLEMFAMKGGYDFTEDLQAERRLALLNSNPGHFPSAKAVAAASRPRLVARGKGQSGFDLGASAGDVHLELDDSLENAKDNGTAHAAATETKTATEGDGGVDAEHAAHLVEGNKSREEISKVESSIGAEFPAADEGESMPVALSKRWRRIPTNSPDFDVVVLLRKAQRYIAGIYFDRLRNRVYATIGTLGYVSFDLSDPSATTTHTFQRDTSADGSVGGGASAATFVLQSGPAVAVFTKGYGAGGKTFVTDVTLTERCVCSIVIS